MADKDVVTTEPEIPMTVGEPTDPTETKPESETAPETETKPGETKPGEKPGTPTEPEEPTGEMTPAEEAAYLRGQVEGLEKALAARGAEVGVEDFDDAIAKLQTERKELVVDELDEDPAEVARKLNRRMEITEEIADLRAEKTEAQDAEAQEVADQDAADAVFAKALKGAELPASQKNTLTGRVNARLKREGFTIGKPPTAKHFNDMVELEALKLAKKPPKTTTTPAPKPGAGQAQESAGPTALEGIEPGTLEDVREQMEAQIAAGEL